jgi:ABC transport system ATP-binding/permease protein
VAAAASAPTRIKLSFKENRELASLPAEIEQLEQEQRELAARMSSGSYHAAGSARIKVDRERGAEVERLLEEKFARWAELDARNVAGNS